MGYLGWGDDCVRTPLLEKLTIILYFNVREQVFFYMTAECSKVFFMDYHLSKIVKKLKNKRNAVTTEIKKTSKICETDLWFNSTKFLKPTASTARQNSSNFKRI